LKQPTWNCSVTCPSRKAGLFNGLNKPCWDYVQGGKTSNVYRARQTIYYEGNKAFGIYCLTAGKIKLYRSGRSGRQQINHIAKPGEILGVPALLGNTPYLETAETLEECKVCFIEKTVFLASIKMDFALVENLLSSLSREVGTTLSRLESAVQKPVRGRVAELLCGLMKDSPSPDGSLEITLSRTELAELADTAQETVIRTLKEFARQKYISIDGKNIRILQPEVLTKLAAG